MGFMINRNIFKAGAIVLCAILMGISGCVLRSLWVRWQSQKCLDTVRRFQVGLTTEQDAENKMTPFREFEVDGKTTVNGKDYLTRTYRFQNSGFHLLRIFHPSIFQTGLIFGDGVVVEKGAGFLTEPFLAVNTRESITGFLQNSSLDANDSGVLVGIYEPPVKMDVFLDTRAAKTKQKAAFGYNLSCFTTPLGCKNIYEILPEVK
jgi:hypothetical protein